VLFNLPCFLEVLLCYRGRVSYEVGLLIADIVERYGGYQS
jgi:hypothetical protein